MTVALNVLITTVVDRMIDTILPPLITAVAGLLVAVLAKQLRKIGLDLEERQQQQMRTTIANVLQQVEEQARRKPMPADLKRETAIGLILERTGLTHAEVEEQLDTVLPEVRAKLAPGSTVLPATLPRS